MGTLPVAAPTASAAAPVFISHSSRDADTAAVVVSALESAGIPCWIAPRDIAAGSDWNHSIMTGIAKCSAMLLVYSRHSVNSDPVTREVERAVNRKVPVIPVRLEQAPPSPAMEYMISTSQWIDAFPPPIDRHLDAIIRGVKRALQLAHETPKPDPHAPPDYVGPYRVLEKLGEGGMGTVYKAEQRSPVKRTVALKLIRPGLGTQEVLARFESERQALARMNHPSVARVIDAGVDTRGNPYFAMEYVPGVPITQFADANKLSIRDRLLLFKQVCEAIAHAHTKSLLHRDIKASNVLAYMEDGKAVAKVIDFGIAKALTGDRLTDRTFATERGLAVGTYESMSPEQADGSPDIDTRTDVYSLGALLYELLTGAKPFDQQMLQQAADHEIRRIIREVEPPRPSTRLTSLGDTARRIAAARQEKVEDLSRALRRELEWIPLKAMRKERDRRYESPLQMAEDVERYLGDQPLIARPDSTGYRLRKALRRNRAAVATVAFFLFVATSGAVIYLRDLNRERRNTEAALALAETQRREAQKRQREAEANFRMARRAVQEDTGGIKYDLTQPVDEGGDTTASPQAKYAAYDELYIAARSAAPRDTELDREYAALLLATAEPLYKDGKRVVPPDVLARVTAAIALLEEKHKQNPEDIGLRFLLAHAYDKRVELWSAESNASLVNGLWRPSMPKEIKVSAERARQLALALALGQPKSHHFLSLAMKAATQPSEKLQVLAHCPPDDERAIRYTLEAYDELAKQAWNREVKLSTSRKMLSLYLQWVQMPARKRFAGSRVLDRCADITRLSDDPDIDYQLLNAALIGLQRAPNIRLGRTYYFELDPDRNSVHFEEEALLANLMSRVAYHLLCHGRWSLLISFTEEQLKFLERLFPTADRERLLAYNYMRFAYAVGMLKTDRREEAIAILTAIVERGVEDYSPSPISPYRGEPYLTDEIIKELAMTALVDALAGSRKRKEASDRLLTWDEKAGRSQIPLEFRVLRRRSALGPPVHDTTISSLLGESWGGIDLHALTILAAHAAAYAQDPSAKSIYADAVFLLVEHEGNFDTFDTYERLNWGLFRHFFEDPRYQAIIRKFAKPQEELDRVLASGHPCPTTNREAIVGAALRRQPLRLAGRITGVESQAPGTTIHASHVHIVNQGDAPNSEVLLGGRPINDDLIGMTIAFTAVPRNYLYVDLLQCEDIQLSMADSTASSTTRAVRPGGAVSADELSDLDIGRIVSVEGLVTGGTTDGRDNWLEILVDKRMRVRLAHGTGGAASRPTLRMKQGLMGGARVGAKGVLESSGDRYFIELREWSELTVLEPASRPVQSAVAKLRERERASPEELSSILGEALNVDTRKLSPIDTLTCGEYLLLGGDVDQAVRTIRKAIDAGGVEPFYRKSLGWALLRQGEIAAAKLELTASIDGQSGPSIRATQTRPASPQLNTRSVTDIDKLTAGYLADAITRADYINRCETQFPALVWFYIGEKADIVGDSKQAMDAWQKSVAAGKRKWHRTAGWAAFRLQQKTGTKSLGPATRPTAEP